MFAWTKRALVVHGAFCDRPRRGNDPGDDLDISCTAVPIGDTAHTTHTMRLPDVLRRCETPRYAKLIHTWYLVDILLGAENAKKKLRPGKFPRNAKKKRPADKRPSAEFANCKKHDDGSAGIERCYRTGN